MASTDRRADRPAARALLPGIAEGADGNAQRAAFATTRALVAAERPTEVVDLLVALVETLGGVVVPAQLAPDEALPIDLALGEQAPLLPVAPPLSMVRLNLETLLPGVVDDARDTIMRLRASERLRQEASIDVLTGVLTRRALFRQLNTLGEGDAVALLDLDHFKRLNDTEGHATGDQTLREFGALLRAGIREGDIAGRYGGEELVVGLRHVDAEAAAGRLHELRSTWLAGAPAVTFSAGIALVLTTGGGTDALTVADRALYRAKENGRDRCEVATAEEDDDSPGVA